MLNDDVLRSAVREVLLETIQEQQTETSHTSGDRPRGVPVVHQPRTIADPERAALAARVAAWLGRPQAGLGAGQGLSFTPAKDRAGYLASTPARLGVGRAGTRNRTETVLEFRADHAAARDAVWSELEPELMEQLGLLHLRSAAADKSEFLRRPDLGRRLDDGSAARAARECPHKPQVQIVVGDGLSATAIRVNAPRLLPELQRRLQEAGVKLGRPIYIQNARVAVADQVGTLLQAELLCMLVGERPGLKSAESVGAYITYFAGRKLVEAQRSVISNIHDHGIPPEEGARRIAQLCLTALKVKGTGIDLGVR